MFAVSILMLYGLSVFGQDMVMVVRKSGLTQQAGHWVHNTAMLWKKEFISIKEEITTFTTSRM